MSPPTKYEKKNLLNALNEEGDAIYRQERVTKTKKREPVLKNKTKKPQRVNVKDIWQ